MEDFRAYYSPEVWTSNISTLDSSATASKLEYQSNCTDFYLMFQEVKTPVVADRALFETVYNIDLPNGDFMFLQTS